jgi:ATP-binding cassette subfamily B protein RaxB
LRAATLDQIRDGAAALGLTCTIVKRGIRSLAAARRPLILYWDLQHFVVFEGMQGHRVGINDPAVGRRRMSIENFEKHYTGVCLDVEVPPRPARTREQLKLGQAHAKPGVLRGWRWRLLRGFSTGALGGLAACLIEAGFAGVAHAFYDFVIERSIARWGLALTLAGLALVAARFAFGLASRCRVLAAASKATLAAKVDFVRRFCELAERPGGEHLVVEIVGRLRDLDGGVRRRVMTQLQLGESTAMLMLAAMLVVATAPLIALVQVLPLAITTMLSMSAISVDKELQLRIAKEGAEHSGLLAGAGTSIARFHAMGMADCILRTSLPTWSRMHKTQVSAALRQEGLVVARRFFDLVVPTCLLFAGCYLMTIGAATYGAYSFASLLALAVSKRADFLLAALAMHGREDAALRRAAEILDARLAQSTPSREPSFPEFYGGDEAAATLVAKNITYRHAGASHSLFAGFSLEVNSGEVVCITGPSGTGKTTLLEILAGLRVPTEGAVWFRGGHVGPAHELPLIHGDSHFVAGSVADFVAADLPLDRERLSVILKRCELSDRLGFFALSDQREDLATLNLSMGEIQRLHIANALYVHAGCILFDEAFCHLSLAQSRRILSELRREGAAMVLASHRPEIHALCDRVVQLPSQTQDKGTLPAGRTNVSPVLKQA